ncbi:hypothetical protein JW978_01010 [Candidatus Dojkabacteria bacterium]|nr:hypothetical protein [Candidatus Dojkabacteria bacterium]
MSIIKNLAFQILILSFVVTTFNGVIEEEGVFSLVATGIMYGLVISAIEPILGFFKFPKNFWGFVIVGTLLTFAFFFMLDTVVVGFLDFRAGYLGGAFGPVEFPMMEIETETLAVIVTAVYSALLTFIFKQLDENSWK